jgi:hypothetical protein
MDGVDGTNAEPNWQVTNQRVLVLYFFLFLLVGGWAPEPGQKAVIWMMNWRNETTSAPLTQLDSVLPITVISKTQIKTDMYVLCTSHTKVEKKKGVFQG